MKVKSKLFLGAAILGIAAASVTLSIGETGAVKADAIDGSTYVRVTEELSDWSGTYLIGYFDGKDVKVFDGSLTKLDAEANHKTFTLENGAIPSTSEADALAFTFESTGNDEYSIKSKSCYYIGKTSDQKNGLDSSSTSKYTNSVSFNESEGAVDIVGSGGPHLRFNSDLAQGNNRFRYYKSTSYKDQQPIQLYKLTGSEDIVLPTSIEINAEETTISGLGDSIKLTATILPEESTNKAVIWSTNDPDIATVDTSGLVKPGLKNGEAIITAACAADEMIKDEITITVSIPKPTANSSDAFLLDADFPETNSSKPNYAELSNGIVVEHQAAFKSEYHGKPQITIYSDPGYIANVFALEPISKIILIPASTPQYCNVEVYSGITYEDNKNTKIDPKTLETEDGTTYWEYTFAEGQTFFNIFNDTGHAQYLKNIIIEFGGEDANAAHVWAQDFLDTTAEECAALEVKQGTWTDLAASYNELSSGAKDIIKADYPEIDGELYTTIQKAIERYSYIVGKYGYENFINIDLSAYVAPLSMPGEADSTFYIALGSILGAAGLAIAAAVIIKKRSAKASK